MSAALELRGLRKHFGRTEIIRGVDLQVEQGERLALIGPNGAGKSTLFHLISGRLAPSSGTILLRGQSIAGRPPQAIARLGLARSFQVSSLFGRLSVLDNLRCAALWGLGYRYAFWRRLAGLHDVTERARELATALGLEAQVAVPAVDLSYANQRALEVGMTLAGGAHTLLLDEPTAGMSRGETAHFIDLIRRMTQGKTLLVVEHDMEVVFGLAQRIAVLVQGRVIACDTPQAIRANPQVQTAYLGAAPARESA